MRIARAMAQAGINSRRKCEQYIRKGEVSVNGETVHDLGRQVDPEQDEILFRGRPLRFERHVYYVLHKPAGYITTAHVAIKSPATRREFWRDPKAPKNVFELLPSALVPKTGKPMPSRTRVFPVGRLDRDTTGLLLFTNDGDLANRLMHPRFEVDRWYEVRLDRAFDPRDARRILSGVRLDDGMAKAVKLKNLSRRSLRVLIREGRNREVRRIFGALGYEVISLCRTGLGPLSLGALEPGRGCYLSKAEAEKLKKALSTTSPSTAGFPK